MNHKDSYAEKRTALQNKFMGSTSKSNYPLGTDGMHHLVLISSDLDATIAFYTRILCMKLVKIIENRDDPSSTHIFLDMGGGNLMAFFDFPKHGDASAVRGIGSMHHLALKANKKQFSDLFTRLKNNAIAYSLEGSKESGSVYFRDPDNVLIEVTYR